MKNQSLDAIIESDTHVLKEIILTSSDGTKDDLFGYSVSLNRSGEVLIVGATLADAENIDQGKVYVFRYNGAAWVEEAILTASDGDESDWFGESVSINDTGDVLVVGAYGADAANANQGKVYIFRYIEQSWVLETILTSSYGDEHDSFGISVSINGPGNVVVIGAKGAQAKNTNQGKTYVFRYNGSSWVQEAILMASDGLSYDYFGASVSINGTGDTVVVGSYFADTSNQDQGKAYVFMYNGTSWEEAAILTSSDGMAQDRFGRSVSINEIGNVLVVGAYGVDESNPYKGKAYVFRFNGTSWVQEAILMASDGVAEDYFGIAVSINGPGDTLVVGADWADCTGAFNTQNQNQGKVYIFKYNGSSWVEEGILMARDGSSRDEFGHSVSINGAGDVLAIGADLADTDKVRQGKVYVFT